jgi:hypothetical protein
MEINTVHKCQELGLKNCHVLEFVKEFEINVSMKIFMDRSVPFSSKFIEVSCIPKVLIELPIAKTSELRVEIGAKIENQEEH